MARRNKFTDVFKHLDLNPVPPCTCWLWKEPVNDKGLPYFQVDGRKYLAYRLTYWLTHPEWDINNSREYILHSCVDTLGNAVDNPLCCNPAHLRPGTHEENMMDMMLRGRSGLTREIVFAILTEIDNLPEFSDEMIGRLVGHKFNREPIPRQTVADIRTGRRRKVLRDLRDAELRKIDEGTGHD